MTNEPDRPALLVLDIETTGEGGQGGLDPRCATVLSVAVWDTLAGQAAYFEGSERKILTELDDFMITAPTGVVVTWNGANFDLPFLAVRYRHLGVENHLGLCPAIDRPAKYRPCPGAGHNGGFRAYWGPHDHIDISYPYQAVADQLQVQWSLKPVAEALGIPMVHVDAARIGELDGDTLRGYNISDVKGTAKLTQRLAADMFENWLDGYRRG